MADATNTLLRLLPRLNASPIGRPSSVPALLNGLQDLKRDLDRITRVRRRPPYVRRMICAAVVIEARKLLHREPCSTEVMQVCADYWVACGGKEIGEDNDPNNWRRNIDRAKEGKAGNWIRQVLAGYAKY
jgi:hypothetical protein